jgi:hypothetical protein
MNGASVRVFDPDAIFVVGPEPRSLRRAAATPAAPPLNDRPPVAATSCETARRAPSGSAR